MKRRPLPGLTSGFHEPLMRYHTPVVIIKNSPENKIKTLVNLKKYLFIIQIASMIVDTVNMKPIKRTMFNSVFAKKQRLRTEHTWESLEMPASEQSPCHQNLR